ncbi:MAG: matrixin family metalloprotease [Nostoc sp. ChiSLP01]|nr:M10 family metallopeptidase [Nostoc sp. CmiSLP01]MDZ8285796.1 M10 family metallopeptidase [Nostoc sp. ChiSLP01]
MSTFVGSTGVSKTGLVYVDSLLWGSRWKIENDNRKITYSFVDNQYWDYSFDSSEINAFTNAIKAWSNVANFQLEYSGFNDSQAELTFHSVDSSIFDSDGVLGQANPPGESNEFGEGDVRVSWEPYYDNPNGKLLIGSYYYYVFIHEIGHALGLAHPHDRGGGSSIFPGVNGAFDDGDFGLNQFVTTIMSYNTNTSPYSPGYPTNWGYTAGPMAFDIAAIQHIYGINKTYNTGNNVYLLPTYNGVGTYWSCIWDAGGTDTISGQGATNSVIIDLNNATLANNDPDAGGFISQVVGIQGGFTIANSQGGISVIENAIGGNFNDTLTGNQYNNYLSGESGNDVIDGKAGNDSILGGAGNDTLYGGAGNDTLNGGSGNNSLYGGTGNDRYIFTSDNYITITEYANEGTDTVESAYSFNLGAAYLENLILTGTSAINATGNTLNNTITGNGGNNQLNGDTGNDTLNGGGGNDTLTGGTGNDSLIGGTGNDILVGSAGSDTLTGGTGTDRFTFNSRTEGTDKITDFSVVDDTIYVSAAGFGGGLVAGAAIAANRFFIGSAATTSSQRFLYDKGNGSLFFDQDGTGAIAKIQIATLNAGLSLTNADIFVAA